ncbi:MAG: hypothetical protein SBU_000256 [Candidatus Syntrophoarchaeum butanivorans]|uniref:Uncharacterized protein n=1 Tax=Candidatus Syntropharchaeum butanivorans TaxID=1839936 RepID=A0A1F2P706_9EURY|nr:MAG: hypothetical protein SBU_000256 [Candidatus Syntrophoarchaeum butanivorans]
MFTVTLGELAEVPGSPYAYWAPKSLRELFQKYPPLDRDVAGQKDKPKIADVKKGMDTGDDLRFTRYWWEINVDNIAKTKEESYLKKWVPFNKGGKPFYFSIPYLINWLNNGEELKNYKNSNIRNENFYFQEGIAWVDKLSWVSGGSFERLKTYFLPKGCIFSAAYHAAFMENEMEHKWILLSWLRSKLVGVLHFLLDPNIQHINVGNMSKMPFNPGILQNQKLSILSKEAYWLLREWDTGNEISTQFIMPWILQVWRGFDRNWKPVTGHPLARDFEWSEFESAKEIRGDGKKWNREVSLIALANECVEREKKLRKRIEEIQKAIDEEVYRIYGISEEDRKLIEEELSGVGIEESESDGDKSKSEETEGEEYDVMPPEEHIRRLLSYYALEVMKEDADGIVPASGMFIEGRKEPGLATRVIEKLKQEFEEENLHKIETEINQALGMTIEEWFEKEFFNYHTTLYRLRPIIWQLSSEKFRQGRRNPSFTCFIYWHKLDEDTLPKVRQLYLKPILNAVKAEADRLSNEVQKAEGREKLKLEKRLDGAIKIYEELKLFDEALENLLKPHSLKVSSRSEWVKEKVNEIVTNGYKPNRDYGVRVNIEPLKQAKVLARAAERVKG